jgi:hypothetical protein
MEDEMPFDRSKYPDDWEEISRRIKERDGNCCKQCGVENGAVGYRLASGEFVKVASSAEEVGLQADALTLDGINLIRIVLTVAHWPDPDPMNCEDDNLQALCQRCHNRLDGPMRRANAAQTRRHRKIMAGQIEFEIVDVDSDNPAKRGAIMTRYAAKTM